MTSSTAPVVQYADEKGMCTGGEPLVLGGETGGVVFPLLGDWEADWPQGAKIVLYALGLAWCFLGVSIIADVFMGAIEKVTSQKRTIKNKDGKPMTVTVWNATVANLTLMALGSSAPEILLSVIELILTNKMHSGELGPSTIVGSAAFNLMVIMAVCVSALPEGDTRRIDELGVYAVTATFSLLAYVWLLVILVWISPDVVEIWEGAVTFALFPVLVFIAYLFDIHVIDINFASDQERKKKLVLSPHTTQDELAQMWEIIRNKYGEHSHEQLQALLQYEFAPGLSRAAHRVHTGAAIYGKKRTLSFGHRRRFSVLAIGQSFKGTFSAKPAPLPKVEFERSRYAVVETDGKVTLNVRREGRPEAFKVKCRTVENTATAREDYDPVDETLEFAKDEDSKEVTITIVHDEVAEMTEDFFVELYSPEECIIGETERATVVILDADYAGRLAFKEETVTVVETSDSQLLEIEVHRSGGSNGDVSCSFHTEDGSAKAGYDYEEAKGDLEFKDGELIKKIEINILSNRRKWEGHEMFRVMLTDPVKTEFPLETDGGKDSNICTVHIKQDADKKTFLENALGRVNWHEMELGTSNWKEQFMEAIFHGGSFEEQKKAGCIDMLMHFVAMPWKLLFAFVPPVDFAQGWVCFFVSLLMIGCVTAVIGDLAMLLGCSLEICDPITAITFVALGTSLPDTFASKSAAMSDDNADNSIGNVTGSNSVNVFLGLGMPWLIGAVYWNMQGRTTEWEERGIEREWPSHIFEDYPDGAFVVPAKGLSDSVAIFSCCAVVVIAVLFARRLAFGAELGGPKIPAYLTSGLFVLLWGTYIGITIYLLDC